MFWNTPLKFNIAPENKPSRKERIIFQPPFFRGKLAVKLPGCITKKTYKMKQRSSSRCWWIDFTNIKLIISQVGWRWRCITICSGLVLPKIQVKPGFWGRCFFFFYLEKKFEAKPFFFCLGGGFVSVERWNENLFWTNMSDFRWWFQAFVCCSTQYLRKIYSFLTHRSICLGEMGEHEVRPSRVFWQNREVMIGDVYIVGIYTWTLQGVPNS